MTLIAGVAGQPIAHSLSPLIHGAWIAAAGLDAEYRAFGPEDEAGFTALVAQSRAGGLRGLNVTAPFKAALAEQAPGLDVAGAPVVILGAGGAARAAAAALKAAGGDVGVLNRTQARAAALAADLGVRVATAEDLPGAALVVNALSVRPDVDGDALRPDAVLMDMTYRPLTTSFLAAGRDRGLVAVDGLAMLIGQARPSFEALFGVAPPPVDVRALALAALGEAS